MKRVLKQFPAARIVLLKRGEKGKGRTKKKREE